MRKDRIIDLLREEQTPEAIARIMGNKNTVKNTTISNWVDRIKVTDEKITQKTYVQEQSKIKIKDSADSKNQIQGDIEK